MNEGRPQKTPWVRKNAITNQLQVNALGPEPLKA